MPRKENKQPLSDAEWKRAEGRLSASRHMTAMLRRVKEGGICDAQLRRQVWPILLGAAADKRQRTQQQQRAVQQYFTALNRCASLEVLEGSRGHSWRRLLDHIKRDVSRIAARYPVLQPPHRGAKQQEMVRILSVYAMGDPGVGYCQGLADILAPLVVVFPDEWQAGWAFGVLMQDLRKSYLPGLQDMLLRLQAVAGILDLYDPPLGKHLRQVSCGEHCSYAFQMLAALFTRELPAGEVLVLWEAVWAARRLLGTADMYVYCCASLLRANRKALLACKDEAAVLQTAQRLPKVPCPLALVECASRMRVRDARRSKRAACGCTCQPCIAVSPDSLHQCPATCSDAEPPGG